MYLEAAPEWRATSVQVCGLWPFAAGAGSPMVGVPVGRHLVTGATLCCDPISWFDPARGAQLISNPSAWISGLPGLGKSTLVRRLILGMAGRGVVPLIVGDLKPDHRVVIEALRGDVVEMGRGRCSINVMDATEAFEAAERLTGSARGQVIAEGRGRRLTLLCALLTVLRGAPPGIDEELLLERAIELLDERHGGVPLLADLVSVLDAAPDELRRVARDHDDIGQYRAATDPLIKALLAMLGRGRIGELFSAHTTTPIRRGVPTCFDLSSIDDGQPDLQRAAMLACWAVGFSSVEIGHVLADAGIEPRRYSLIVMDEAWRILRGRGMVEKVDALSRLNRTKGVGTLTITHTLADLEALPDPEDRAKARGLVERAGMVILGGLPEAELDGMSAIVGLSVRERELLTSWVSPPSWGTSDHAAEPPGRGRFLAKIGSRPGLPFRLALTQAERGLADSNARWQPAGEPSRS